MTDPAEELLQLVRLQLGRRDVRMKHRFIADLGAESFDLLRLAARVEDHFLITFPEEELSAVRRVEDLWNLVRTCRDYDRRH